MAPAMTLFAILLGGEATATPRLARQLAGARVIAADSGIAHARLLGLQPELWTGDFDSVGDDMRADWPGVPQDVHPREKNLTDGEIAVEAALARGASTLLLVGAFGGPRPDHAFLHLTMAMRLAEAGIAVCLTSGDQEAVPILPGAHDLPDLPPATTFSVIAFTELDGLTIEGARWPLDRHRVPFGSSLTISNEVSGKLRIALGAGRAMLVAHLAEAA
jgi:thiamine pyrophosphokinase